MMTDMQKSPPSSTTFVLRFWRERSVSGTRWRGSIKHIPDGSHSEFLGVKELLMFLQRFEVHLDDMGQFLNKEGLQE
jgi:hypothetical protein